MKSFFLAVVHAFVGMVVTLVVSLRVRGFLSQLHSAGLGVPPQVEFDIVNFLPIFIFLGFSAGYVVYTKIGGKSALWIWIIPTLITGAKIMTFHSPTVFESGIMAGWKYLFDYVPCSARNLYSLAATARHCVDRVVYLGLPVCALSYSAGSRMSQMRLFPSFEEWIKNLGAKKI